MDEEMLSSPSGPKGPGDIEIVGQRSIVRPPSEYLPHLPPSTSAALTEDPSPTEDGDGNHAPTSTNGPHKVHVDAQGRTLNPRSCVTCRKRKVKCEKLHPCSNCNRAHIECVFPAPGRAPRKARKLEEVRDKELLERLRRLEGVVKGLGVDVPPGSEVRESSKDTDSVVGEQPKAQPSSEDGSNDSQALALSTSATSPTSGPEPEFKAKTRYMEEQRQGGFENRFGRLVINEGKSRYINNSFWANLSNEVEDLKGILNSSSAEEEGADPGTNPLISNHQGWVFGFSSQNVDMLSLHPLPGQIAAYWDVFKDRVDPLVKVLHIPTIEPTVLSAASHLSNLSRGFETLLFTIYYAAVTASSAQDCLTKFNEDKQVLLSRYRFAFEQSLARANFLTTEEIIVLQAFVIFLICLRRNHDARVIWTLTGLVVRISQTLGIHRDGLHFGLSPFEVEMRRRLWWQVCILDVRASEDHGCDPTIIEQAFDTKMPLNINDADISPETKDFPPERQGCTGMSFCLIRFEVANTFRRINYVPPGAPRACGEHFASATLQDKEKWITECHQRLEERYLRHCDMSVPMFWVTATVARLMMSKMWLMVYHPFQRQDGGASLPKETKGKLFITSLENVEYSLLLETEARTMKWGWLFRTYMQWHALAFMLSELCHRSTGDLVERAWVAVEKTRDGRWGRPLTEDARAGHLWRPLGKLYRKAKEARQRGMAEELLSKQGANGQLPVRTYSPNANPMFGHPKRPQVTRAPLSNAQLQRFAEGASYGEMPTDKHEWLKSPKLSQTVGGAAPDPMDTAELPHRAVETLNQNMLGAQVSAFDVTFDPPGTRHQIYAPTARTTDPSGQPIFVPGKVTDWGASPQFAQNFVDAAGNINFGFPPHDPNQAGDGDPTTTAMDLSGMRAADTRAPLRMDSVDSASFDLDPGVMDTSGDVNWQNWDELVRQFGMDVDTTFDRRPGDAGIDGVPRGGATWNMVPNPVQANLRMGMGMGMGGGDWF